MIAGSLTIDISWADSKLEKHCSTEKAGQRHFGTNHWKLVKRRLASLRAASTLQAMEGVPGRCHALGADRAGQFAVALWGAFRLIFVPDHDPLPLLDDGGIARDQVTKVSITEVVNYHGD